MAYPDIPQSLRLTMAARAMREHHHLWHLARMSPQDRGPLAPWEQTELAKPSWQAPRLGGEPGAGIDFLGMHRGMIKHVNAILSAASDSNWPRVVGWNPIPFEATNADWPVPVWPSNAPSWVKNSRAQTTVQRHRNDTQNFYQNPQQLAQVNVDRLGTIIEGNIHGWMHLRWAAVPTVDTQSDVPENDFLAAPFSSHVNPIFWKLHGWIEDRIKGWETANHATVDLSASWNGPADHQHHGLEMATADDAVTAAIRIPTIEGIPWFRIKSKDLGFLQKLQPKAKSKSKLKKAITKKSKIKGKAAKKRGASKTKH